MFIMNTDIKFVFFLVFIYKVRIVQYTTKVDYLKNE